MRTFGGDFNQKIFKINTFSYFRILWYLEGIFDTIFLVSPSPSFPNTFSKIHLQRYVTQQPVIVFLLSRTHLICLLLHVNGILFCRSGNSFHFHPYAATFISLPFTGLNVSGMKIKSNRVVLQSKSLNRYRVLILSVASIYLGKRTMRTIWGNLVSPADWRRLAGKFNFILRNLFIFKQNTFLFLRSLRDVSTYPMKK